MASLISKPGLTNASTALAIPKDWSASWFKGLVSNLLQGADVRNAVGVGCIVSGNITSPYATITVGGATNPITAPLIINGTDFGGTSPGIAVNARAQYLTVRAGSVNSQSYQDWFKNDGVTRRGYFGFGDTNDEILILDTDTATGQLSFRTKATERMGISSGGTVTISAPDSGNEALVVFGTTLGSAVHVHPVTGLFGVAITIPSGSNQFGIFIDASVGGTTRAGIQYTGNTGHNCFIATADAANDLQTGTASGDLVIRADSQAIWVTCPNTITLASAVNISGNVGFNNVGPQAASTGWGTPTGNATVTNFPGATATLVQCSEVIAQLITQLKRYGLFGA